MLEMYQIIGFSGGIPTQERGVSSMMISTSKYDMMIDCGEGTYLRWQKAGYEWSNLKYILITHMHPDHTGGLVPLLFYRKLFSIETMLTFIGPPLLQTYITESFKYLGLNNNQDCRWYDISQNPQLDLQDGVKVMASEMEHKIPCWGYRISDNSKSLVFITDTLASSNAVKLAQNSDVLIHEATYNHKMREKASKHFHTTNIQAMDIADEAKVNRLILTHFNPNLTDADLKEWVWNGKSCVIFDKKQKI